MTIRDKAGQRVDDREQILTEYEKYYKELLQTTPATTDQGKETEKIAMQAMKCLQQLSNQEETPKTTTEDIVLQRRTLKERKASDTRGSRNENVIHGGDEMLTSLQKLFTMVDEQHRIPESWKDMWIKAIFKDKRVKKLEKQEDCS